MREYRIEGVLESPLVVRRERQSQRSEGVRYVSGTLVRGALAQAYLQEKGQPDNTFASLFLDEDQCRFGPLDPGEHVFARTAYSCKRYSGFAGSDRMHGVIDILVSLLASRLQGRPHLPQRCRECASDLKPMEGFWEYRNGQAALAQRRWRRSSATHVGIDRLTHTAAEGMLFSLPTMEPEASPNDTPALVGWVHAAEPASKALQDLLDVCNGIVRIGHARTRGYGKVRLKLSDPRPPEDAAGSPSHPADPQARWQDFSRRILAQLGHDTLDPETHFLFTLGLPSGAVLLDPLLRYTLDPAGMVPWLPPLPSPDPTLTLEAHPAVELGGGTLRCITAVAQHERVRGWNAAHGLPRQDEWAVIRGAVYAYIYQGDTQGRAELFARLRALEQSGLGARRNEGFGRVVVCDEFHVRFAPERSS